jgi:hypothetical protein
MLQVTHTKTGLLAAAVVCRYEAWDLVRSSLNDPHARDLKTIDTIFTDIRHRLGEAEPESLPLDPKWKRPPRA